MSLNHEGCFQSNVSYDDEPTVARPAILIVDDRAANLIALEAVLERLPARIVRANSGEEALTRSTETEFALVLLDWRMPGIDGIEAARQIRARTPGKQPPVIILTAHLPDFGEIRTAYAAGVVDFLQKPYSPEVLTAKVSVFIELYAQREKLRLYEEALRKRFEEELVGIVSHDLRSPLNAITLAAQSILRRAELSDGDRRSLGVIQSAAGRAGRLVHDLLDYTQILHGTAPPIQREKFGLSDLTREILEEVKASFPATLFALEQVGSTDGLWDRDRLAQVVANLASNAATYGSGGTVTVRLAGDDAGVTLEVHNDGEPIPAELIPDLFEPMRRGTAKRGRGHVGLGLFIVREIVRAHGGSIAVQSVVEGTTFSVKLPSSAPASHTRMLSAQPASAPRSGGAVEAALPAPISASPPAPASP